jgi:YD repeat-containing protein
VLNQKTVGDVSSLSVLSETTNAAGQTLRRVTDTSGAVIELTLDAAGKVISSRVVSQAKPK